VSPVAFVAIARNEGERLKLCLRSILPVSDRIVYVDSGSTDGSVEFARSCGVEVLPMDTTKKFSMSRARNAGCEAVVARWPDVEFVHFIDGDCELVPGWVDAAMRFVSEHPDVAVVCGRRLERHPERSVFNRLCEIEWNTPVGEAKASGGDALMRVEAFRRVGGFNEELIAGEEPELCLRLRRAGGRIWRLGHDMTRHDANITKVSQWWGRHVRAGYAAADVSRRTAIATGGEEILFRDKLRSPLVWTAGTCLILLGGLLSLRPLGFASALGLLLAAYAAQSLKIAKGIRSRCRSGRSALEYGISTMLAKWPQTLGIFQCWIHRKQNRQAEVIDYKQGA